MDRNEPDTNGLLAALRRFAGQRIFTAVLGSPDPDGLASAWALAWIARQVDVHVDILTFEVVSRPDNAAFVQLLGVPFRRVTERLPRVKYAGFAVVDRQNARLPVPHPASLPLVAHIDHHSAGRTRAIFSEQTVRVGSTSTLMAHHLTAVMGAQGGDPDEVSRIATALLYGIRTDTTDFLNANAADFQAAALLAPLVSPELMRQIAMTPLGRPFMETLGNTLLSAVSRNGFTVGFAGRVGRRARDTVGQSADFLIRGEGTVACVAFGIVDGNVVGSLRASTTDLDPYQFLDDALSRGLGFPVDCGGRMFAGGFLIPAGSFGTKSEEEIRQAVTNALLDGWTSLSRRQGRRTAKRLRHGAQP